MLSLLSGWVIYFDHNATSPMLPVARDAWLAAVEDFIGNPSSPHRLGSRADRALESAAERLARVVNCDPEEIVFTSGATEANNLALWQFTVSPGEVWLSALEHPSVLEPARTWFGDSLRFIPVLRSGAIDLSWIQEKLKTMRPRAIVCIVANNETGVIQPWLDLQELCAVAEIPLFCDATQFLGRMDATLLGRCAFVSGSAHKFGGPRGVGFLKCPSGNLIKPAILGGGQQSGRRAGTENVPGVLGMLAALEHRERQIRQGLPSPFAREFEANLSQALPGVEIVGSTLDRLWNTVSILAPAADCRFRWVVKLDKLGFAVSTGSACASGQEKPSHVLTAMGYSAEQASRALRFSSSWETPAHDWAALLEALQKVSRISQRMEL